MHIHKNVMTLQLKQNFPGLVIFLHKIFVVAFQDPAYNVGKFGEMKELLLGMLDTYTYEKVRD